MSAVRSDEENKRDVNCNDKKTPHSPTLLHCFTLEADSFVDHCPDTVPALTEDFFGVHPDVPRNTMSALAF